MAPDGPCRPHSRAESQRMGKQCSGNAVAAQVLLGRPEPPTAKLPCLPPCVGLLELPLLACMDLGLWVLLLSGTNLCPLRLTCLPPGVEHPGSQLLDA